MPNQDDLSAGQSGTLLAGSLLDEARAIVREMSLATDRGRRLSAREAEAGIPLAMKSELRRAEPMVSDAGVETPLKA